MFIKPKIKREIYLDHAATTYCDPEVVKAMLPYFTDIYGNPSSLYHKGLEANGVLNDSRRTVAKLINALPENIIFTGGGSESDNLAIYGIAQAHQNKGKHIITSAIEHHAILHPLRDLEKLHVDLMTVNGSKMYGPKGVGMLYMRRGVRLKPLIIGGAQERHLRAGTENVPAIVGFAKAFELAQSKLEHESKRVRELTTNLWSELQKQIPNIKLNGPQLGDKRLPNNLNITFVGVEGESLLLYLDEYGIMCSTGSACTSESINPSHVLLAIGLSQEDSHGSLRFTLGHCNTQKDIEYIIKYLPEIIKQLRETKKIYG